MRYLSFATLTVTIFVGTLAAPNTTNVLPVVDLGYVSREFPQI